MPPSYPGVFGQRVEMGTGWPADRPYDQQGEADVGEQSVTYAVGIDVGTTFTAAAISRDGGVEPVALTTSRVTVPSVVFAAGDERLFGGAAERRGVNEPDGLAREFKRRVGDPVPLLLSGSPYHADRLTALMANWVLGTVAEQLGGPPAFVVLTHPANWTEYQLGTLRNALADVGFGEAELISEPAAAAIDYAAVAEVPAGASLLVYDLGGGTFDVALLRREGPRFEHVVEPAGIERLGGIDFDEAVFQFTLRQIPRQVLDAVRQHPEGPAALLQLKRRCVDAKEALSSDPAADVPVMLPDHTATVRITRGEFEAMIRPSIQQTIELVHRTIDRAGVGRADLSAALLVGGSSRIPLVSQLVAEQLEVPVRIDAHPKLVTARGAARLAGTRAATRPAASSARPARGGRPPRSRTPLLIGGGALALASVAVAGFLVLGGGDDDDGSTAATGLTAGTATAPSAPATPAPTSAPGSTAPATTPTSAPSTPPSTAPQPFAPFVVEREIPTQPSPIDLEVVGTDLWVMSRDEGALQRFDLASGAPTAADIVPLGFAGSADVQTGNDIVAADGFMFVTQRDDESVARVDLAALNGTPLRIAMPGRPLNAAVLGDTLWVTVHTPPASADRSLVPIDVATGAVGEPLPMAQIPYGIAAIGDELWVTFDDVDQIGRVDPATGEVEVVDGFRRPIDIVAVDDDIWVTMSEAANQLARVDPQLLQIRDFVSAGFIPWKAATATGSVWVINRGNGTAPGTVSRFDATTNDAEALQEPITVGVAPIEIAVGQGRVYVANLGSGSVSVLGPAPG